MSIDLIAKYGDARLPRYTSYPTAPKFSSEISAMQYREWLGQLENATTSLYLHIPFCRSMCWYCGCHTSITERDQPILDYLDVLNREIDMVADTAPPSLDVREIHFGGGTPTIIKPGEFTDLVNHIRQGFSVAGVTKLSVEIDPRTLTAEMADALGSCSTSRASLGVQSFDPVVQKAINRIQSEEVTSLAVERLRANGIGGVNFDLIYGLPYQTVGSCVSTVEAALRMRPDRFSVFGYAHIPAFKKHQRLIDENALPDARERHEQARAIASALVSAGYIQVGLDHFALPEDDLAKAVRTGGLRRNFQGYTTDQCNALLGFGASAIGRLPTGYVQNEVPPGNYARRIAEGGLPISKGYRLTREDRCRGQIIERLMCDFKVDVAALASVHGFDDTDVFFQASRLREMEDDGVIEITDGLITLVTQDRYLVRAVAATFDAYLTETGRTFSKAA